MRAVERCLLEGVNQYLSNVDNIKQSQSWIEANPEGFRKRLLDFHRACVAMDEIGQNRTSNPSYYRNVLSASRKMGRNHTNLKGYPSNEFRIFTDWRK